MLLINEDNSAFMAQHKRDISAATRRATATANYHSANSSSVSSSSPDVTVVYLRRRSRLKRWSRSRRGKRDVEIISGRDRRLQGEGEETGARLQRDRSGVSEMEPLPATQDALRLELRPAEAWNYATLRLCRRLTRRDSAPNDGRSSRVPPCRHRCHLRRRRCRHRRDRVHSCLRTSGQLSRERGIP